MATDPTRIDGAADVYETESGKPGARYSGMHYTGLDCDECGGPFEVEGDVSNGEVYTCDNCGAEVEVYGR